jgi:hypothetical protein
VPAAGEHALAAYTEPLYQRDYPVMLHGSWVEPLVGHASRYRDFARAFRTLPARPFETVARDDGIAVRRLEAGGATWFYVLNNHPSPARVELTLDGAARVTDLVSSEGNPLGGPLLKVTLPPYGLRTFRADGAMPVRQAAVERPDGAYAHVGERLAMGRQRLEALKAANVKTSAKYDALLGAVGDRIAARLLDRADRLLPDTLLQELDLRQWMMVRRPRMIVNRTDRAITLDGSLDDWAGSRPDAQLDSADHLANDHHFGHQWSGPGDLGATVQAAHDGATLFVAVRVSDDRLCEGDGVVLRFPRSSHSLAEGERVAGDRAFRVAAPTGNAPVEASERGARLAARPAEGGYTVEAAIPLAALAVAPGGATAMHLLLEEIDYPDFPLPKFPWSRIQHMEWPVNPWWTWWRDPQCAGALLLAP